MHRNPIKAAIPKIHIQIINQPLNETIPGTCTSPLDINIDGHVWSHIQRLISEAHTYDREPLGIGYIEQMVSDGADR